MADYKKMYTALFNDVTDAIVLLQQAQQKTEDVFVQGDDTPLFLEDCTEE